MCFTPCPVQSNKETEAKKDDITCAKSQSKLLQKELIRTTIKVFLGQKMISASFGFVNKTF